MLRDRVTVRCLHRHCGPMVLTFVPFAPERALVRATCAVGRRLMATTIRANVKTPTDLRDWLKKIDDIGELQVVTGANTEEDIGMATELLGRTRPSKATIFDEIPGYKKGFRVLSNGLGSFARIALTLGLPIDASPHELVKRWQERVRKGIATIAAEVVKDGPVFENVLRGDQIDCTIFPAPKFHEFDGGRYLGTGSFDVTIDRSEEHTSDL